MKYYSFDDIQRSHNISREALKQRVKSGKLKAEKLQMSEDNPNHFKYIIPETELSKLAEFQTSIPVASKNAQPDYYVNRWAKQEEQHRKWQEEYQHRHEESKRQIAEVHKRRKNYYEYMHSEEWRQKRLKVLKRDGFRCQMCGTAKNLRVHHINYEHLGTDAELDDLITLCDECHRKIHEQDIKKKAPLSLFDDDELPDSNSAMFQLALRLLREYGQDRIRAWDIFNEARRKREPSMSAQECSKIWLNAWRTVDDWCV